MTVVELLRHAKAHSRKDWHGSTDRDRPLTDGGWHQAKVLTTELPERGRIDAIYSSPLIRCTQTVEPLADVLGLDLVCDGRIGELRTLPVTDSGSAWVASAWLGGRALSLLEDVLARHPDARVVVCSHGDVLPAVLALLAGRDGLDLPDVRVRKGARVTLRFDGVRCVEARHVAAAPKQPD